MSTRHLGTKIYMSYAYVDNQNFITDDRGWISAFQDDLENELSFLLGKISPITIFHDKQFGSPNLLTIKYIRATDVFIAIGTPAYFLSDFCQKELKLFLNTNDKNAYQRVFLVDKRPFEEDILQVSLPFKNFFPFYDLEKENEWSRTIAKENYFSQIQKLALQIKKCVADLK